MKIAKLFTHQPLITFNWRAIFYAKKRVCVCSKGDDRSNGSLKRKCVRQE